MCLWILSMLCCSFCHSCFFGMTISWHKVYCDSHKPRTFSKSSLICTPFMPGVMNVCPHNRYSTTIFKWEGVEGIWMSIWDKLLCSLWEVICRTCVLPWKSFTSPSFYYCEKLTILCYIHSLIVTTLVTLVLNLLLSCLLLPSKWQDREGGSFMKRLLNTFSWRRNLLVGQSLSVNRSSPAFKKNTDLLPSGQDKTSWIVLRKRIQRREEMTVERKASLPDFIQRFWSQVLRDRVSYCVAERMYETRRGSQEKGKKILPLTWQKQFYKTENQEKWMIQNLEYNWCLMSVLGMCSLFVMTVMVFLKKTHRKNHWRPWMYTSLSLPWLLVVVNCYSTLSLLTRLPWTNLIALWVCRQDITVSVSTKKEHDYPPWKFRAFQATSTVLIYS